MNRIFYNKLNCSLPQVPPGRHLEAGGRLGENLYRGGHTFFEHPHAGAVKFCYGRSIIQFFVDYYLSIHYYNEHIKLQCRGRFLHLTNWKPPRKTSNKSDYHTFLSMYTKNMKTVIVSCLISQNDTSTFDLFLLLYLLNIR